MALKAYEDVCLRAELFGQPKPDKEDFLEKNKHLDIAEFEEIEIKTTAETTAMLNDDLKNASGGLSELNTILNSTQTKLNRLKGVCGSLTNFFRIKLTAKDNLSYSSEPSYVGQTNYDKDFVQPIESDLGSVNLGLGPNDNELAPKPGQDGGDINTAIDNLQTMKENTSLLKHGVKDVKQEVTSQISKLDSLINKAERAETSLQYQNKQMRSFLR